MKMGNDLYILGNLSGAEDGKEGGTESCSLHWISREEELLEGVSSGSIHCILLDFTHGDQEERFRLLGRLEAEHPELLCIAVMAAEEFSRAVLLKKENMEVVFSPVRKGDIRNAYLSLEKSKVYGTIPVSAGLACSCRRYLYSGGEAEESICGSGAEEASAPRFLPLLLVCRSWREAYGAQERDTLKLGYFYYLARMARHRFGSRVEMSIQGRNSMLLVFSGVPLPDTEEQTELAEQCIRTAEQGMALNASCYWGVPCSLPDLPEQVQELAAADLDNVTSDQARIRLDQKEAARERKSSPEMRDWMVYLQYGRLDDFSASIHEIFQERISMGTMNRDFLARFQQDLIQELGKMLKDIGIQEENLLNGSAGMEEMEQALRSVENMEAWVYRAAEKTMKLVGIGDIRRDLAEQIKDYIQVNVLRPVTRETLSEHFHLSGGYIARVFREKMGINITTYINQERISMARRMLEQSDLSLKVISDRCGYSNYQYFFKKFKEYTGMAPTEYREKMHG